MRLPSGSLLSLCASLLFALPALAQEEGPGAGMGSEGPGEDGVPHSVHPGSDSPESAARGRPAEAGTRRKAQAFLIPLDEQSRAATARVAQALEGVLAGAAQYEVIDLGRALSVESTPEQASRAAEGRKLSSEGNVAYAGRAYADAAVKYKAALKAMEKGLPAVQVPEYAELWLRLAAALQLEGEEKASREAFLQVVRLDPQQKLQARNVEPLSEQPLASARADAETLASGVLEVDSKPTGARVTVDGEAKGQAPMRLELQSGRHLVKLERAGFYPHVELSDVVAKRPGQLTASLTATPTAASLNQVIAGAAEEVGRGEAGPNVARLAERFGLERVLIGSVSTHGAKLSVLVALVDAPRQRLVAKNTLLLTADGTDADQVESDTQQATRKLIALDTDANEPVQKNGGKNAPAPAAPAPESASGDRRAVMPGSAPAAPAPADDDPGLAARERKPAAPAAPQAQAEAAPAATASDDKPAPASADAAKKKKAQDKKKKGIQGKSGTERWGEDDE